MTPQRDAGSVAVAAIFVAASVAVLLTSPTSGNFWWSDAPRHALNGAFVKDFIVAHPWRHPLDWAVAYYLQYPALTILFYPPLFYAVEAVAYLCFGVSHLAAQGTVAAFVLLLAASTYGIARQILPRWSAVGAALLLIGAPEIAFWARQVMLDIPAFAAVAATAWCFVRYATAGRPRALYGTVIGLLAAMAIKQTAVFLAPAMAIAMVSERGWSWFRERHVRWALGLWVAGTVPLAILTVRFGMANLESVTGRPGDLARSSVAAWTYYLKPVPHDIGLVATVLAVVGAVLMIRRREPGRDRWVIGFLAAWFVCAYGFFSAINNREPRHGLMMLLPVAIAAVVALQRLLPSRLAQACALVLGGGTLAYSLITYPPPTVDGYPRVADFVASHAPRNAVVMFHGIRDGNFIYGMRSHEERRDIMVVRTDKVLVRVVAGERIRGVQETDLTQDDIAALIRDMGVDLVVYQPGFWADLRQMARFAAVLHTGAFERVASFDITGTAPHDDRVIEVYRPTYPVQRTQRAIQLDMPMVRGQFRGELAPR
jgi:hypothetical protein